MTSSSIAIKVQYGYTLKRIRVAIQNGKLALDIFTLREKIRSLFSIDFGVDFTLTYSDEENEEVTLSADGDDDLDDIVQQALNPLYIYVYLTNSIYNGSSTHQLPGWPQTHCPYPSPESQDPYHNSSYHPYPESRAPYQNLSYPYPDPLCRHPYFGIPYYNHTSNFVPLQTPSPNFNFNPYSNSNFGAPQTSNSSTIHPQSQTVNPAVPQTRKTELQHHPYQTSNTETGFSVSKLSELVEKMKVGASVQSNVDGQQSGTSKKSTYKESKIQVNPEDAGNKNSHKYRSKLDGEYLHDITIPGGTIMAPLTKFTKIWRMRNKGTIPWPHGSKLQWIKGDLLCNNSYFVDVEIPSDGLPVNGKIDIAVEFIAPAVPGHYLSYWTMISPNQEMFGQSVYLKFQVVDALSMKAVGETSTNVNQPSVVKNPEVVNQEANTGNKLVSDSDLVFNRKEMETALQIALESAPLKQLDLNSLEGEIDDYLRWFRGGSNVGRPGFYR